MKKIRMRDLKISKKLSISFMIVIVLGSLSNGNAMFNLRKSGRIGHELFTGPYKMTDHSMGIRRDIVAIDQNVVSAFVSEDPTNTGYKTTIVENFNSIDERLKIIRDINIPRDNPAEAEKLIDDTENAVDQLKKEYEKVFTFIDNGDYEKAKEMVIREDLEYYNAYSKSIESAMALYQDSEALGIKFDEGITYAVGRSDVIATTLNLASIFSGIFICAYIIRSFKKPIEEIEVAANKMADGDFDITINYESKDELGILANSMRQMSDNINKVINDTVWALGEVSLGNFYVEPQEEYIGVFKQIEKSIIKITSDLSETMSQINAAAEEVGAASDQVASGAQMLSQGATEQASAIEELSATIIEVSEKIKGTADNAKKANSLTLSSARQVKDGNEQMKEMVKAMEEISFTSNEIGRIIKTIDDIAFQTNILALNAAVEAARAGSAGKGFAVVADEVRNLAAKSAEAAKNTATLIENSIKAVDKGTKIVDNTAESLQKINNTTSRTTSLVGEIATTSEEEASAITQITLGLEQISEVVQTNSATSEESAAASEELSGQAQTLKSLIDNFKLKDTNGSNKNINFNIDEINYLAMNEYE